MNFETHPQFKRDFKKLFKKYRSLDKDLETFKKVLEIVPLSKSKNCNILTQKDKKYVVKARFFCKYLKGDSLRIIYAYFEQEKKIVFVEIYHKSVKEREDAGRTNDLLN